MFHFLLLLYNSFFQVMVQTLNAWDGIHLNVWLHLAVKTVNNR